MSNKNPQNEMKQIIENCIDSCSYTTACECLDIYQNTFGCDQFYKSCELTILNETGPLVSLICIQSNKGDVNNFLSEQNYKNLEVFYASSDNLEIDISTYLASTNSTFVSFYEPYHKYNPWKLANMVFYANRQADLDALICDRNFIDENNTIIANPDYIYQKTVNGKVFYGQQLIEASITNNVNIYGNLSTLLLSTRYAKKLQITAYEVPPSIRTLPFFYQLLLPAKIGFMNTTMVSTILKPYENPIKIKEAFENFTQVLYQEGKIRQVKPKKCSNHTSVSYPIRHEITFFYSDKGEYYNLKPLGDEAEKRGYKVIFTENLIQKAEIGIYCQHFCSPENSKFSIVLLHDLAQGHNRWPNIWEIERWDKFDLGILPGKAWADRWSQCACQYYANPRYGAFNLGYPKNDMIHSDALKKRVQELQQQLHLKYDISILYAPSWENDGKEDDFITALSSLKVNLLIKQANCSPSFTVIIENINHMRKLHEGKFENVYYIDTKESIQTALALCDLVVSEESSVMSEAVMFNKLSIAVTDWLIPDVVPSRFASIPMDYIIKCKKDQLREYVIKVLQNPEDFAYIIEKGKKAFDSPENVCKNILNAIEFFTTPESNRKENFYHKKLTSKYAPCSLWN